MMSLAYVFYIFIGLAMVVGALRGWAKELLVIFSAILGLFIIMVFQTYVGIYNSIIASGSPTTEFWVRSSIMMLMAFFGYQTPKISRLQAAARREKARDMLLGAVFGAVNGYLIIGSIWSFLEKVGYQNFPTAFLPPDPATPIGELAINLVNAMPPNYLMQAPAIYITIAVAFTIVVIVYV
jgi:uncharacterized membrane protein required for colicin V production